MADIYIPSTRGIVKQLLKLASDPENHGFIFKEAGLFLNRDVWHSCWRFLIVWAHCRLHFRTCGLFEEC